ncbi:MAG TPA: hypothetical protein VME47_14940 [Acetobacteraceae bacterium]|nr:hypothetical protein [Acetobacteraceae bacterium]
MTEPSNSAGTPQPQGDAAGPGGQQPNGQPASGQRANGQPANGQTNVRPVGTWVVAGFLLFATLVIWGLVSVIFQARS